MGEEQMEVDADVLLATTSSLETAADDRRRRLLEMKARVKGSGKIVIDENEKDNTETANGDVVLAFRSYVPADESIGVKRDEKDLFALEREIQDQLADTEDTTVVDQVDVGVLAPRKVDWDLKRDIAERMEVLEKRTQKAIVALIKQRFSKGQAGLATAVNSVDYDTLQDEDDN